MVPTRKKKSAGPTRAEVQAQWKRYFGSLSPDARRVVRQILGEIRKAAPGAVPVFSYRIPGYRLLEQPLLWAAGFKHHVGMYPVTGKLRTAHAAALKGYKTSTGTVQFPLDEELPLPLVRRLIKGRIAEIRAAAKQ